MVKRVIIGRSGAERLIDMIEQTAADATAANTRPAGTKVLDDDEDVIWSRPDGTEHSVRDVDAELEGARGRIEDAEQSLIDSQVRLDDAEQQIQATQSDLDTLETVTLPAAVQALEAADAAAQQELATLDGKLATAQQDLVTVGENIDQLETDLATESDAREQLAQDTQTTFTELDTRLGAFATDEALAPIRQALTDAQNAVDAAQQVASAANTAANAASQAALEAAGIAESKGRVIIQETEPQGADRNAANIWIRPVEDDPETEVEERAITYVYLEASDEWIPTTSDELAQAAQNALDAREAAQQAQQRAETAISNAATAQAAAEAAQTTADQATLDAAQAHNEAVAAQETASAIRDDMASGPSLWADPSFERGMGPLPGPYADRIERSQDWAASGSWSVKYTATGSGGNNYGSYRFGDLTPGHWYAVSATVHAGEHEQAWNTTWDARTAPEQSAENLGFLISGESGRIIVGPGETKTDTWFFQAPEGGVAYRFWAGQLSTHNGAEHEGQVVYVDDFRLVDVTDTYPQYLAAQQAAADAQTRADEAYTEAASKATPAEVQAAANAAEQAAKQAASLDATAKAAQAKADALTEAAVTAQEKADAAKAQAVADAAQDAADKADQALQDALAALATARGEITAEITASANGKNSITISTSAPSGSGVVAGDTWWRVDGSGRIFGQWRWTGSAWSPATIRSEVIANLDVHKLIGTSGEFETFFAENFTANDAVVEHLWADQLAAKVVTAQQVTVAPGNSFPDPGGLNVGTRNSVGGAQWSWNEGGKYWRANASAGATTQFNAYLNTTTGYDAGSLTPGETYRIAYDIWHNGSNASQRARAAIYYRRADGSTLFTADGDTAGFTTPGAWSHIERSWTAPSDAVSGGFTLQLIYTPSNATEVRIRNPFIGVKAGAVSIKNGAVSADHVNAESVAGAIGEFVEAEVGNLKATEGTIGSAVIDKIWADGIAAKSITATRLTVAPGNLIPNGSLDGGDTYWDAAGEVVPISGVDGFASALTHNGGTIRPYSGPTIPVKAGERYVFECWIRADKPNSRIFIELRNQDNTLIGTNTKIVSGGTGNSGSYMMSSHLVPTTWTKYRVEFTAVAGTEEASFSGFHFNHSNGSEQSARVWLTGFALRPMTGAVLIEDGAITTPKLTVTGDMSAAIVNAMSVNTKRLVVTEDAILNHATLIGQTVVDNINVQGKLIGTDGVFTGTVDFANINVTDQVLADRISGEHLYGTEIEGGLIYTTNSGSGQVTLSDTGYVDSSSLQTNPGIRITPPDMSELVSPPGMGPNENGFIITGGQNLNGGRGYSIYSPNTTQIRYVKGGGSSDVNVSEGLAYIDSDDGLGNEGRLVTTPDYAFARATAADGSYGTIEATNSYALVASLDPSGNFMSSIMSNGREAYMWSTGSDGLGRILSVDSDGVWVKAQRDDGSGYWDHINLLGDDWDDVTLSSGWSPRTAGGYYEGLRVRRLGGSLEINGAVQGGSSGSQIGTIVNPRLRPTYDTFVVTTLAGGGLGQAFVGANGSIMHSYGANSPGFLAINVSIPLN